MMNFVNGIQQVGIGVANAKAVFNWYRLYLGFDILLFEDESPASLMTKYTGGKVWNRYALLAMNLKGGGGLEIWQFKDREPEAAKAKTQWGDIGINAMKVRSTAIEKTHVELEKLQLELLTPIKPYAKQNTHFFFKDPWGNLIEVVSDSYIFGKTKSVCGGVMGATIGVTNIEESTRFYQELLEYDTIVSDQTGNFKDFTALSNGNCSFRRVLLKRSIKKVGGFGALLGPTEIELIQVLDQTPKRIYENRIWGDLGYIHLCFDIQGMGAFREKAETLNYPFTVDSADSFDMGEAAGRFGYVEDPDGTLIELVETHKVPIIKYLGLSINLKNRNPMKPLPKWLVKAMRVHRVSKNL